MPYLAKFDFDAEYENGPGTGTKTVQADTIDELKHKLMLYSVNTGNWNDTYYDRMRNICIFELVEKITVDDLPGRNERIAEIAAKMAEEENQRKEQYEAKRRAEYEKLKEEFEGK